MSAQRIGVIADTHGLLRPQALDALAGSDLIVHAGDIGNAAILQRLGARNRIEAITQLRGRRLVLARPPD